MPESIQDRVLKVISKSQRMPIEKITPDSTFEELGIDSMDAINILFDLESEFEIEIDDEKARQLCKVSEMIEGVTLLVRAKESAAAPPQS